MINGCLFSGSGIISSLVKISSWPLYKVWRTWIPVIQTTITAKIQLTIAVIKLAGFISFFLNKAQILPSKSNKAERKPKATPNEVIVGKIEVISTLFQT